MADVRITYAPRPDATPESEFSVLAAVYKFVLDCHTRKEGGPAKTAPDDAKGSNLLALIRELYSRHPEYRYHEAWELAHVLWSLGYTNCLAPEGEIAAAVEVARTDFAPDEGA